MGSRNTPSRFMLQKLGSYADFTSTSELPFASFSDRVLLQNVSYENDLIFMRMNVQVKCIFMRIVLQKDSFCHRGKSQLEIGLSIHELAQRTFVLLFSAQSYGWSSWSGWTPCDDNCFRTRERYCYNSGNLQSCGGNVNVYGVEAEKQKCPSSICPGENKLH